MGDSSYLTNTEERPSIWGARAQAYVEYLHVTNQEYTNKIKRLQALIEELTSESQELTEGITIERQKLIEELTTENQTIKEKQQTRPVILGFKARKYVRDLEETNQECEREIKRLQEMLKMKVLTIENHNMKKQLQDRENEIAKERAQRERRENIEGKFSEESWERDEKVKLELEKLKEMAQKIVDEQEAIEMGYVQRPKQERYFKMKKAQLKAKLIGLVAAYRDYLPPNQFDMIFLPNSKQTVADFLYKQLEDIWELTKDIGGCGLYAIELGEKGTFSKMNRGLMWDICESYMSLFPQNMTMELRPNNSFYEKLDNLGEMKIRKQQIHKINGSIETDAEKSYLVNALLYTIAQKEEKMDSDTYNFDGYNYLDIPRVPRTAENPWERPKIEHDMEYVMRRVEKVTKDDGER